MVEQIDNAKWPADCNKAVPLRILAWVLDPKHLFFKAFPDRAPAQQSATKGTLEGNEDEPWWHTSEFAETVESWEGSSDALGDVLAEKYPNFRRQRELARYYEAQINLFAEMCLERSYNAIFNLEPFFDYEMLVGGLVDKTLPETLRAKFGELLLVLWIDRFPHQKLSLPAQLHQILPLEQEKKQREEATRRGLSLKAALPFCVSTDKSEIANLDDAMKASHALAEYHGVQADALSLFQGDVRVRLAPSSETPALGRGDSPLVIVGMYANYSPPVPPAWTSSTSKLVVVDAVPFMADSVLENASKLKGNIAIVSQGADATVVEMATRASEAGAVGIIVVNTDNALCRMIDPDHKSEIPVIMIKSSDAKRLREQGGACIRDSRFEDIPAGRRRMILFGVAEDDQGESETSERPDGMRVQSTKKVFGVQSTKKVVRIVEDDQGESETSERPDGKRVQSIKKVTRPSDKFALVQFFIRAYLKKLGGKMDEERTAQNTLTVVVVQLLRSLISFGFVATRQELVQVIGPLLETLDGRLDRVGVQASTSGDLLVQSSASNLSRHQASTAGAKLVGESQLSNPPPRASQCKRFSGVRTNM